MKKLIINADDFGLHAEVNAAVQAGHISGCITSASVMAMGAAFDDAVKIGLAAPSLDIGAHLTLVAAKPILPPDKVRSLIDKNGLFLQDHIQFIHRYLKNEVNLSEVRAEFSAQISRIRESGLKISHLDSHQHLHALPKLMDICIALTEEFKIDAMRIPAEPYFFTGGFPVSPGRLIGRCGLTFLSRLARAKLRKHLLKSPDHFFGMLAGGRLKKEYLKNILLTLPAGTSEIMIHPGKNRRALASAFPWGYQWDSELDAVTDPSSLYLIREQKIKLSSFGELSYE